MNKIKTKSKTKLKSTITSDDDILDYYIKENQNTTIDNNITETTPLAENLKNKKREQLSLKLKNAIQHKNNMRIHIDKKIIEEQTDEIKNMFKHPKMTQQILELYAKALVADMTKTLPTPPEIFDNTDKYKKQYYQYILEILNKIKEEKLNISHLNKLLDNPYGHYISKCIDCPLNPFNKS